MKSNYMKSAELKISKNPDMDAHKKNELIMQAWQKESDLNIKLGKRIYISSRGYMPQFTYIDECLYNDFTTTSTYTNATTTTATQLTRENLDGLIESVRTTSYNGFSTGRDYYRPYIYTWDPNVAVRWGE